MCSATTVIISLISNTEHELFAKQTIICLKLLTNQPPFGNHPKNNTIVRTNKVISCNGVNNGVNGDSRRGEKNIPGYTNFLKPGPLILSSKDGRQKYSVWSLLSMVRLPYIMTFSRTIAEIVMSSRNGFLLQSSALFLNSKKLR